MTEDEKGARRERHMTRIRRRLIEIAADIIEKRSRRAEFLHSVLCQVALPRARTEARSFQRSSGRVVVEIEAGKLYKRGRLVPAPLPYGAKPRLILLHLCGEAVRTRNPEIEVGRSTREFLKRLGLDNSGHEYARFRIQMEALAACRMTLGMSIGGQDVTVNSHPISKFEAWTQHDGQSIGLWPGSMTLSGEFYTTLLEHAVPLDPRAIAGLQKSSLALDTYTWLAHRLCRVRKTDGVKISWANLRAQFGQEYACSRDFKKEFRAALLKAHAVYPGARVSEEPGGLRLFSSPTPVPKSLVVVKLPRQ